MICHSRRCSVCFLLLAFALRVDSNDLAVVRVFASQREILAFHDSFESWKQYHPCSSSLNIPIDLVLVYSQDLDLHFEAQLVAEELQSAHARQAATWHQCFRDVKLISADLSAEEDVYDHRGYSFNRNWVNGPNEVFRFILGSFMNDTFAPVRYDAFYFMEMDANPIRQHWLDQFVQEALYWPPAAIRGSRYKGDNWDAFRDRMSPDILLHINGNAIYSLSHPWLKYLNRRMQEEYESEHFHTTAFDVWMANITLEADARAPSETESPIRAFWGNASAPPAEMGASVSTHENVYAADSVLIGNYAATLMNSSFHAGEYVRHNSLKNIFEDLDDSKITLVVSHWASSFQPFEATIPSNHPFRNILVLSSDESGPPDGYTKDYITPRGSTTVTWKAATMPAQMALCDLAHSVTTEFFIFTDTYHVIASPTYVLMNGSSNGVVLPYITADSTFCQTEPDCVAQVRQAERLFNVSLKVHHDTHDTVFVTQAAQTFCNAWVAAADAQGLGYEQCGLTHGPTADDYMSWLTKHEYSGNMYIPKNKAMLGWRPWSLMWDPPPHDRRLCAVYTREEHARRLQSNISHSICRLQIEDEDACNAMPQCIWRPMFGTGKCIIATVWDTTQASTTVISSVTSSTPVISEISMTVTTSSDMQTVTVASATSSLTVSSEIAMTSTTSATRTVTTFSGTKAVTETTSTQTSMTVTSTILRGACAQPPSSLQINTTDCINRLPTEICTVSCGSGYLGESETYTCTQRDEQVPTFVGSPPICRAITATVTVTTTTFTSTVLVTCDMDSLPAGIGLIRDDCIDKHNGETCRLECASAYEGGLADFTCNSMTGLFEGPSMDCKAKTCKSTQIPGSFRHDCQNMNVNDWCWVSCPEGYKEQSSPLQCVEANLTLAGDMPTCVRKECDLQTLPHIEGVNASACIGSTTGEVCKAECHFGYVGSYTQLSCLANGSFSGSLPRCELKSCDVPTDLHDGMFDSKCAALKHGQTCVVSCGAGYEGQSREQACIDGDFKLALPICIGRPCLDSSLPYGVGINVSECFGKRAHETCNLTCVDGYTASGQASVQCQSDRRFVGSRSFSCAPVGCGNLSLVGKFSAPHVDHFCDNQTLGDLCVAFCKTGFDIIGDAPVLRCHGGDASSQGFLDVSMNIEQNAIDAPGPSCEAIPCTANMPNMRGRKDDCAGKSTWMQCNLDAEVGYEIEKAGQWFSAQSGGATQLSCEAGGAFRLPGGNMPKIRAATCPAPIFDEIQIGSTCKNVSLGAECWAYCKEPHYLGKPKAYNCTINATAMAMRIERVDDDINCTPARLSPGTSRQLRALQTSSCDSTSLVAAGLHHQKFTTSCEDTSHDEVCLVHCSEGWIMIEQEPSVFVCENGVLVGSSKPTCVHKPCQYGLPNGVGVQHTCNGKGTNQTCLATCNVNAGYAYARGSGEERFTCQASGNFEGTSPSCVPAPCQDVVLPPKFVHDCRDKVFGETCGVACAKGYTLEGPGSQWQCHKNGSTTGGMPVCVGNLCHEKLFTQTDLAPAPDCIGLRTGETCVLRCAPGFVAAHTTLSCGASGFLLGRRPSCTPQVCDSVPALQSQGVVSNCQSVVSGESCTAFCSAGFQGQSGYSVGTLQCKWNETLQTMGFVGDVPQCKPVLCSPVLSWASDVFVHNCTGLRVGDQCTQSCASGYTHDNSRNRFGTYSCLSNRMAVGASPSCHPAPCNDIDLPNLIHNCKNMSLGSSCQVSCGQGYMTEPGPQEWYCSTANSGLHHSHLSAIESATQYGTVMIGRKPSCKPRRCLYDMPAGRKYTHACAEVTTGGSCKVACAAGFHGAPTERTCLPNARLAGTNPECVQVCTGLPNRSEYAHSCDNIVAGGSCNVSCLEGFDGESTMLTCGSNYLFSGVLPRCHDRELIVQIQINAILEVGSPGNFSDDLLAQQGLREAGAFLMGVNDSDVEAAVSANYSNRRLRQVSSGPCAQRGQVAVTNAAQIRADSRDLADMAGKSIMNRLETFDLQNITQAISGAVTNYVGGNLSLCYAPVCVKFVATVTVGARSSQAVRLEVAGEPSKANTGLLGIALVAILGSMPCVCFCCGKLYYTCQSQKVADEEVEVARKEHKAQCTSPAPERPTRDGHPMHAVGAKSSKDKPLARGRDSFWLVSEQPEVWAVKASAAPVPESVSHALDAGYILSTPNVSETTDMASHREHAPASAFAMSQESYEVEDVEDTPEDCGSSWRDPIIWQVAEQPEVWAVKAAAAAPVPASISHALDAGYILSTPNVSTHVSASGSKASASKTSQPARPSIATSISQPARPSDLVQSLPMPSDTIHSLPSPFCIPTDTLHSLSVGSDRFTLPNVPVGPPLPPPVRLAPRNRHLDFDTTIEAMRRRYHHDVEEMWATSDIIDVSWIEEEV